MCDRVFDPVMDLDVNETIAMVLASEPAALAVAMLPDASGEVGRDADIDYAVRLVAKDVNPSSRHTESVQ